MWMLIVKINVNISKINILLTKRSLIVIKEVVYYKSKNRSNVLFVYLIIKLTKI